MSSTPPSSNHLSDDHLDSNHLGDNQTTVPDQLLQETSWRQQLSQYAGGAPTALISLCEIFLMEVPALVAKVQAMLEAGDTQGLFKTVHTLKSCLSYVAPAADLQCVLQVERLAQEVEGSVERNSEFADQFEPVRQISAKWVVCVKILLAETQASLKAE